jgi:hypothetical protein
MSGAILFAGACHSGLPSGAGGTGGEGGSAACPNGPHPSFSLTITAAKGPVPADTQILVKWSAEEEPVFSLDDATTWKTLDEANIVCSVDPKGPPPTDLSTLTCELWTSGATEIKVEAKGYVTSDETYVEKTSDTCKTPILTDIAVKLVEAGDAGVGNP